MIEYDSNYILVYDVGEYTVNMLQWSSPSSSLTLLGIFQMVIVFFDIVPIPLHLAGTVTQKYKKCIINNANIPNQESPNPKKTLGKSSLQFRPFPTVQIKEHRGSPG